MFIEINDPIKKIIVQDCASSCNIQLDINFDYFTLQTFCDTNLCNYDPIQSISPTTTTQTPRTTVTTPQYVTQSVASNIKSWRIISMALVICLVLFI